MARLPGASGSPASAPDGDGSLHPLAVTYARKWGMTEQQAHAWLQVEPMTWAVNNAKVLHRAGLSPQDGQDLRGRVDAAVAASMSRLVDAAVMASLDTRHLHWWAASGLLRPVAQDVPLMSKRRPEVSFTQWVTEARQYVSACGGDQELAALTAAAGLTAQEAAQRFKEGTLEAQALRTLVAFREAAGASPDA